MILLNAGDFLGCEAWGCSGAGCRIVAYYIIYPKTYGTVSVECYSPYKLSNRGVSRSTNV